MLMSHKWEKKKEMWLLRVPGVVESKDTKTTSLKWGGCLGSGSGNTEDAEAHSKLKMDGHQGMETATSEGDRNLKELGACKSEELDQLHLREKEEMAMKLQVQQRVFEINL